MLHFLLVLYAKVSCMQTLPPATAGHCHQILLSTTGHVETKQNATHGAEEKAAAHLVVGIVHDQTTCCVDDLALIRA